MPNETETPSLPEKSAKVSLTKFVKQLHDKGLDDPDVQQMVKQLDVLQLASIRDHAGFQEFLDGIALHALITDSEMSPQRRWAMGFLRREKMSRNGKPIGPTRREHIEVEPERG